jgi:ribonuclease Z
MPPYFHPKPVNGPFEDPGLFIPFLFEKRAVLFDLGDLYSLSPKDILKISNVFVSHTHMDHFVGFDRLLRILLGRDKNLFLYGPEGFFKNIEGKLAGYSWNLVQSYSNRFNLIVSEVHPDYILTRQYPCQNQFEQDGQTLVTPFEGKLIDESALSVSAVILDHNIPCLGFCLQESYHININKHIVESMGLPMGPWLNSFKQALYQKESSDLIFQVPMLTEEGKTKSFKLDDLANKIAIISPGQKITYITDVVFSEKNIASIISFAKNSDHLFIEASFLDEHKDTAQKKFHLTSLQAGWLARKAGAKAFTIFHFSPRYIGKTHLLEKEAMEAFHGSS